MIWQWKKYKSGIIRESRVMINSSLSHYFSVIMESPDFSSFWHFGRLSGNSSFWNPSRTLKKLFVIMAGDRKWQWIKKTFGVIKDLGLNNQMQQSDLHYLFCVWLRNYRTEAMFSIFKFEKIDQNGLKLDNQKLIHTKSST